MSTSEPRGARRAQFYVMPRRPGDGGPGSPVERAGACVVVLVSTRWTGYLRQKAGILGDPAYERAAWPDEPDTHANGHPFGWFYRNPREALADEARLCTMGGHGAPDLSELERAIERAEISARAPAPCEVAAAVEPESMTAPAGEPVSEPTHTEQGST